MAEQVGFRRDDPHLEELFPDLQALFQQLAPL